MTGTQKCSKRYLPTEESPLEIWRHYYDLITMSFTHAMLLVRRIILITFPS